MKSMNLVIILGNSTRDAELRATQTGVKVSSFSIATNRVLKDKNTGEKKEEVEFHNCVAWGTLAEIAAKYITKGKPVSVTGYLKTRTWEDGDKKKNYRTEIVCNDIILLGDRNGGGKPPEPGDADAPANIPSYESTIKPEDLPF